MLVRGRGQHATLTKLKYTVYRVHDSNDDKLTELINEYLIQGLMPK